MTNPITPQEARDALDRDLDWKAELTAGRRALETIAAMRMEYAVEVDFMDGPLRYTAVNNYGDQWSPDKREAEETLYWHQQVKGRPSTLHTRYVLDADQPS